MSAESFIVSITCKNKLDMSIDLKVPLFQQDNDKYCSLVCVQMLMHYFGDKISLNDLTREVNLIDSDEIHIENAAIFASKRGYETYFYHYNTSVIDKEIVDIKEKDIKTLEDKLGSLQETDGFRKNKLTLNIEYIKTGGHLSTSLPTLELIDKNLSEKIPTIISIKNQVWQLSPTNNSNHYIVVTGKDSDKYLINDPSPKQTKPYWVDENLLLLAWYKTGVYALFIKKR